MPVFAPHTWSATSCDTWMRPGSECVSMRAAMFTVSPKRRNLDGKFI